MAFTPKGPQEPTDHWVRSLRDLRTHFARVRKSPTDYPNQSPRPSPRATGVASAGAIIPSAKELSASAVTLEEHDGIKHARRPHPILSGSPAMEDTMDRFWTSYTVASPTSWRPELQPAALSPTSSAGALSPAESKQGSVYLQSLASNFCKQLLRYKDSGDFQPHNPELHGIVFVSDSGGNMLPRARAELEAEAGLAGKDRLRRLLHAGQVAVARHLATGLPRIETRQHKVRGDQKLEPLVVPAKAQPVFFSREEEENKEVKLALKAMVVQRKELAEARKSLAKVITTVPRQRRHERRIATVGIDLPGLDQVLEQGHSSHQDKEKEKKRTKTKTRLTPRATVVKETAALDSTLDNLS